MTGDVRLPTTWGGAHRIITAGAARLKMEDVSTVAVTATAVVATVTIAVVAAPQASAAAHPVDRVATVRWVEAVSLAASVLAAVSTGLVLLALLGPRPAQVHALYLLPLVLTGSFLALMTQTRAQDEAAVAAPQRDLIRVQRQLSRLSGHAPGGAAVAAAAGAISAWWRLRWIMWSVRGAAVAAVVALAVLLLLGSEEQPWRFAGSYLLLTSWFAFMAWFLLAIGDLLRVALVARGWPRLGVLCAGCAGTVVLAAIALLIVYGGWVSVALAGPVAAVPAAYACSFLARGGGRLEVTRGGGLAAVYRRDLQARLRWAEERAARDTA
jgi:hypothetical protein